MFCCSNNNRIQPDIRTVYLKKCLDDISSIKQEWTCQVNKDYIISVWNSIYEGDKTIIDIKHKLLSNSITIELYKKIDNPDRLVINYKDILDYKNYPDDFYVNKKQTFLLNNDAYDIYYDKNYNNNNFLGRISLGPILQKDTKCGIVYGYTGDIARRM